MVRMLSCIMAATGGLLFGYDTGGTSISSSSSSSFLLLLLLFSWI